MPDLLLELFSEEIPARMQSAAADQLRERMGKALEAARLQHADIESYVSPRHLSVLVRGLPDRQPDMSVERKGPKVSAPQPAIDGFLKSTGLTIAQLEKRVVGKDETYFAVIEEKGRASAEALKPLIETILNDFHWPKSQRWGDHAMHWVRPLKNILCLLGETVIPVEFGHLSASDITYGHRFLAPDAIVLDSPEYYIRKLEDANVLVDHDQRESLIESYLERVAQEHGLELVEDDVLLEEVTGLVEWPTVLIGGFEKAYLDLPPEVLISEMKHHQKYFALKQKDGTLSNHFLIVSNMITHDGGKAVVAGNERVLRARLDDGKFYWNQDRLKKLDEWAKGLSDVTFHAKIGTIAQKVERVEKLAGKIAGLLKADATKVKRAAHLCKADLTSGMVGEFPDLQGVMGRYYAQQQGEDAAVADAIRDHYKPAGANDSVPTEPVAICVALADKIDTLVSMFAIGEKPTGSKDPYALRRAALGVLRIILENNLRLSLGDILNTELLDFFAERLKVMLRDQGIRHDIVTAILTQSKQDNAPVENVSRSRQRSRHVDDSVIQVRDVHDYVTVVNKAKAVQQFLATEDGANLLAAYRRASNILAAEEKKAKRSYHEKPDAAAFVLEEERALFAVLDTIATPCTKALEAEKYDDAMHELAGLRAPLDRYFDAVLVNAEDQKIRENRLYTLNLIRTRMDAVVNFGLVEG